MTPEKIPGAAPEKKPRIRLLQNWLCLCGIVVALASLFCFLLLLLLDAMAHSANPYIGILTYMVSPFFLFSGIFLTLAGLFWERWRGKRAGPWTPTLQINLSSRRDRRMLVLFLLGSVSFLLVSAVGSYQTYHFTESTEFCGATCHTVMEPEMVGHSQGPHARVECVACHIGPGAAWYVKSKLSGMYQVYATIFDKYPRPIMTPIKNLRPAQETCEQCHWPAKFVGNMDRTYNTFLSDETNTPYTVRLVIKVGGADPTHGPVGGIHWHMNVGSRVEYIAAKRQSGKWVPDETRQNIPWVRVTDSQGVVSVYQVKGFNLPVADQKIRIMDCIDCHNRPAHAFQSPDDAVNLAISIGQIDRSLPWAKKDALIALGKHYSNQTEAMQGIATTLAGKYPVDKFPSEQQQKSVRTAIAAVQQIYRDNFFPAMNASWANYPNNIGHKDWPGCFRCHDGAHMAADGKTSIKANDCNACHTILAQGSGADLALLSPNGFKFKHPADDVDGSCNDCHSGGL
ncbi:MAG TPA: NapC/NirT family cytochrome c [Chthoniobacteraceae bacterium]|jgi:nitrate/TMAO reductase-like tetraheme cytochrome c subunit|nr:NapC/NirT family cytochrome c [Chthoniobacteraceae bacterium]